MSDDHDKQHGGGSHGDGGGGGGGHHGGHGGGGGHAEGEHEGAPEWLISFADNVMLQMGFFVILLAMNMGPKGAGSSDQRSDASAQGAQSTQMVDFVIAVREAFNNGISMTSSRPEEQQFIKRMKEKKGGQANADGVSGKHHLQQSIKPSDFERINAVVSFDDKSTIISADGRATIAEFAQKQRDQRWIVEVRGHTSPFESMRNSQRAMDLSYQRAYAVAQAMVESGMNWNAIRVVACGENDKRVGRTFDRSRDRTNQRVEIIVTDSPIAADEYAKPDEPTADGTAAPSSGEHE